MTPRAAFLTLAAAASVRAAGFMDQGCAMSQSGSQALDGSRISAKCNDHICGMQASTVLDLNLCLGNSQGKLVARKNGNFADSCRDCQVSKDFGTLICACDDVSTGVTRVSQFDMKADNTIYNWYGYLSCFGAYDDQTATHDFSHCGAATPAAGVQDPLSCDGCVSAPVGVVGGQQDQAGKAAVMAGGRRPVARPQWRTPAAVVVDPVQAPAAEQVQGALAVEQAKYSQKGDIVQKAQKGKDVVKVQQEPRGVVTPPQVKTPVVNGQTRGSFFARRSSNQVQGKMSTDTAQTDPADQIQAAPAEVQGKTSTSMTHAGLAEQVQAAPAKIQDPRPDDVQEVEESRCEALADQDMESSEMSPMEHATCMQGKMASPMVHRLSMAGQMNAASPVDDGFAGYHGEVPRPVTDQRQVPDVQGVDSLAAKATEGYQGDEMMMMEEQQRPSRPVQGNQDPMTEASTMMMVPRGTRLSGGPVEGMGPAVQIVDGRQ